MDWVCNTLGLPHFNSSKCCAFCQANTTDKPHNDYSARSAWRTTIKSQLEFADSLRRPLHPLVLLCLLLVLFGFCFPVWSFHVWSFRCLLLKTKRGKTIKQIPRERVLFFLRFASSACMHSDLTPHGIDAEIRIHATRRPNKHKTNKKGRSAK